MEVGAGFPVHHGGRLLRFMCPRHLLKTGNGGVSDTRIVFRDASGQHQCVAPVMDGCITC